MGKITTKAGAQGFRWWFGKVEDRDDPMKIGRVKVRAYNVHPQSKGLVKTDDLHWAFPIMPPFSAGHQRVGMSATGIMVDSIVFGFFADGDEGQMPIILGTLASMPEGIDANNDMPRTARGINDVKKTPIGPEPGTAYAAEYPYNKVIQTEKGHVIEIDDTPGNERIHLYHKSGTYTEVNKDGRKVEKVVDDNYHIVAGNEEVYIQGNVTVHIVGNVDVHVEGNVNTLVDGTYTLESKGNMTLIAPKIDLNP